MKSIRGPQIRIAKSLRNLATNRKESPPNITMMPESDSFFYEHENYWEPNVVLACRDLLKTNYIFWDIGANVGGVTRLASRLVGPHGSVVSVEAAIKNFRSLNHNVVVNNLSNVFLVKAAIWSAGGETLTLYNGTGGDDSLFSHNRNVRSSEEVASLTINDLFDLYGMPDLIKMDIEGSEYDALLGAERILQPPSNLRRPLIITESSNSDTRALDLLLRTGYILQDLATGELWDDLTRKHPDPISNWLAIPSERETEFSAQLSPFSGIQVNSRIEDGSFIVDLLPEGRFRADIDILPIAGEEIFLNIYRDKNLISRYHGDSQWLQDSYRSRQFDFSAKGRLTIKVESPSGKHNTFSRVVKVSIYEKPQYSINKTSYVIAP